MTIRPHECGMTGQVTAAGRAVFSWAFIFFTFFQGKRGILEDWRCSICWNMDKLWMA